jgi:hypothetical protein
MNLLLAIQREQRVKEVRLEASALRALAATFDDLAARFLTPDTEVNEYLPGFQPDDDGLQALTFALPSFLWKCRATLPNDVQPLTKEDLANEPPVALVAVSTGRDPLFAFQSIDARNTLRPGWAFFFNPGGFTLQEEVGISVHARLDALHRGGKLYLRSEYIVRRFLDLGDVIREATEKEIEALFAGKPFAVDDWDALKAAASDMLRRKLHAILQSGRSFNVAQIRRVAGRIGFDVQVRNGAVVVPTSRASFRDFVRVIDDAYLQSVLDEKSMYLTTSKRRLNGRAR